MVINDMNELVSIIIPVFNGELYVSRMVGMIKAQTYKNIEVIIVNDGSTDRTEVELTRCIQGDKRFFVYTKENSGPSSSRNFGLKYVKGNYVAFIDSDDYIYPEYVEYLYEIIIRYNADMSCCEYFKCLEREESLKVQVRDSEKVFSMEEALKNLYRKKYITGYPYLKLIKREKILNIKFPEKIKYAEDIIFIDEVIRKCQSVAYGNRVLYIYYQNSNSITHTSDCEKLWDAWIFHRNYYDDIIKTSVEDIRNAVLCKQFIMAMDVCCRLWHSNTYFRSELLRYIKEIDWSIVKNKENKKNHRILGMLSCVSVTLTIRLCLLYLWVNRRLGRQRKKAL